MIRTDSNGEFEFDTAAASFVAEKPGYEGAFIRNDAFTRFRVVLRRLPHGTSCPVCTAAVADRAHGWRGVLQLPTTGPAYVTRDSIRTTGLDQSASYSIQPRSSRTRDVDPGGTVRCPRTKSFGKRRGTAGRPMNSMAGPLMMPKSGSQNGQLGKSYGALAICGSQRHFGQEESL